MNNYAQECPSCAFFQNLMKLIYILLIVLLLNGCAGISDATKLGIKETEWAAYDRNKQKELLLNYKKINKEFTSTTRSNVDARGSVLNISIYNGKAMLPPFDNLQDYTPVKFTLAKNQCNDISIYKSSDAKIYTKLRACFYNDTLYLDPSYLDPSKKQGSISIHNSPLWLSGFTYKNITSSGHVRFSKVNIEIAQE